jgi:succinate dehydrogenase / fumarate reductase cytochrome b subunit
VTLFYCVATLLLGLHLRHGVWSMFHTLGVSHPGYRALFQKVALGVALVVTAGFLSGPLAVFLGIVK